jgi:hypothetical protein
MLALPPPPGFFRDQACTGGRAGPPPPAAPFSGHFDKVLSPRESEQFAESFRSAVCLVLILAILAFGFLQWLGEWMFVHVR